MSISKYILTSNKRNIILSFLFGMLFSTLGSGCASNIHDSFAAYNGYLIQLPENPTPQDVKWSKYLYAHLQKRSMKSAKVVYQISNDPELYHIQLKLDNTQKKDYVISCSKALIKITANKERTLLWLIYQLMETIGGEDERIAISDLPPAILSMNDTIAAMPFDYREVYSPENQDPDISAIYGMNNVGSDWGIWGHHLSLAIGKSPDSSVFATVNGEKYEDQYCFSSESTFRAIENYIIDNYGDGRSKSYKFAIFPNDDDCVCTCAACKAVGNTPTNATPAVTRLMTRLAKRFPNHQFFTSSYLSTNHPATEKLPSNVGVIVSAIDLPLKSGKNQQRNRFTDLIEKWQKATSN